MKLNRKSLRKMILSEIRSIMSEQAGDGELSSEEAEELQALDEARRDSRTCPRTWG